MNVETQKNERGVRRKVEKLPEYERENWWKDQTLN